MNEMLLHDVLDHVRNRFYGKYRGVVTDVDAATMRVKASVPAVLPGAPTGWCAPCVPYAGPQVGFLMLPEVGSGVWIEFEGGDVSFPIWTGCYWSAGDVPSSASADVKTIVTTAGTLSFDNTGGAVTLAGSAQNTLVLDQTGATVTAGSGKVEVGASGVSVNDGALEVM
jgi:phage baseplate assembly protein gpV